MWNWWKRWKTLVNQQNNMVEHSEEETRPAADCYQKFHCNNKWSCSEEKMGGFGMFSIKGGADSWKNGIFWGDLDERCGDAFAATAFRPNLSGRQLHLRRGPAYFSRQGFFFLNSSLFFLISSPRLRQCLTPKTRASPWSCWRSLTYQQADVEPRSILSNSGGWSNSLGSRCPRTLAPQNTLGRTSIAKTPTPICSPGKIGKSSHSVIFTTCNLLVLSIGALWLRWLYLWSHDINCMSLIFLWHWKLHFPQLLLLQAWAIKTCLGLASRVGSSGGRTSQGWGAIWS